MSAGKFTYAGAGVDIDANTVWVNRIKSAMVRTYGPRVASRHGAFAGLFRLDYDEELFRKNYRKPLLIGCCDGVGTKVLLAIEAKRLNTIGIDLVAMNVNDLITCGGEPLFFLDYLAVHQLDPQHLLSVVEGISAGCKEAGCALLGGETAEMPGLYRRNDLDLAGFAVGVVELQRVIDGTRVAPGDVLIGLPSSGVHSNGYTLLRRILKAEKLKLHQHVDTLGESLADALLRPTRIYVNAVDTVLGHYRRKHVVNAMAHVTGGGLPENVGRTLPGNCDAMIDTSAWRPPPIFSFLQSRGVARGEMFRVFNMGIGYVFIVRPAFVGGVLKQLDRAGEKPLVIGRVRAGSGRVILR